MIFPSSCVLKVHENDTKNTWYGISSMSLKKCVNGNKEKEKESRFFSSFCFCRIWNVLVISAGEENKKERLDIVTDCRSFEINFWKYFRKFRDEFYFLGDDRDDAKVAQDNVLKILIFETLMLLFILCLKSLKIGIMLLAIISSKNFLMTLKICQEFNFIIPCNSKSLISQNLVEKLKSKAYKIPNPFHMHPYIMQLSDPNKISYFFFYKLFIHITNNLHLHISQVSSYLMQK